MSFWREGYVRGRKAHRCMSCSIDLPVGQLHMAAAGVHDGDWFNIRQCIACADLTAMIHRDAGLQWDEGVQVNDLIGEAWECYGPDGATSVPEYAALIARVDWVRDRQPIGGVA